MKERETNKTTYKVLAENRKKGTRGGNDDN